jgi:predicted site-specific integrase-resolvase
MDSDLLTTSEAADLAGVAVSTFHGWVYAGRIVPAMKAPGLRGAKFFRRSDVEALMEGAA